MNFIFVPIISLFIMFLGHSAYPNAIEAKQYQTKVLRISQSKRVYLLKTENFDDRPIVGKILLFKKNAMPVVGLKVLKVYESGPRSESFAAKAVKKYDEPLPPKRNSTYITLEKTSDIIPEQVEENSSEDEQDLNELEEEDDATEEPLDYDPELDGQPTPGMPNTPENLTEDDYSVLSEEEEDILRSLTIQEVQPFDLNRFGTSLFFSSLRNGSAAETGGTATYSALGVKMFMVIGRNIFVEKPNFQDSFAAEVGLHNYVVNNFMQRGDIYNVLPVDVTLSYSLWLSELFQIYFYGGIMQNRVLSSELPTEEGTAALSTVGPATGAGFMFRIGPGWDVRIETGTEKLIGIGLLVRY